MDNQKKNPTDQPAQQVARPRRRVRFFSLEMAVIVIAVLSALVMAWAIIMPTVNMPILLAAGILFTMSVLAAIRLLLDPDSVRARQTDAMLQLSSQTLDIMQQGLTQEAAQELCELLLPRTAAMAVAITDTDYILGYAGFQEQENPAGTLIRTQATRDAIAEGKPRVLHSPAEIGFDHDTIIRAAIIMPLKVGENTEGVLKLYYRRPRRITETQKSIALGLGKLLSTQMAAVEMETQRKLATSMELKMLQSQINPHFLFNTINTIASFIRTDPMKARTLLREFAVFYRRTLEDSTERISLARELDQVQRYFNFELARFGDARLAFEVNASPALLDMMVPPFLVQPLVENAIKHAMPSEGKLTITVKADADGDDVVIVVSDDGVGMTEETCANITQVESSTGLGIAVKNVHDRMIGFFGPDAQMVYTSVLGEGTQVTLRCPGCAKASASAVASAEALAASLDEVAGEAAESAEKAARNNATMAELTELVAQVSE